MGQMISDQGRHRPPPLDPSSDEPYYPYDVNAWRRLSQQYLDQLAERGDWDELERYWRGDRNVRRLRLYAAASTGSIGSGFADYTPKSWRALKNSSHLTKNNRYRYHSLANLNRITLTKPQLEDILAREKFRRNTGSPLASRQPVSKGQAENGWTPDGSFDSTSDSLSRNSYPNQSGFERNKPNQTLINLNRPDRSKDENIKRQTDHNGSKTEIEGSGMKMFQEYQPKKNRPVQSDYVQLTFDRNPDSRESPADGPEFVRGDSTRTTCHTQRSFTPEIHQSRELLVRKNRSESNGNGRGRTEQSSFHRRQEQSQAPGFRINSKEKLADAEEISPPLLLSSSLKPNRVSRNSYCRAVGMEDEPDPGYSEEDLLNHGFRSGSRRLMRIIPSSSANGHPKSRNGREMLLRPNRERSAYIPYRGYYLDTDHSHYSRYYQSFDRPRVTFTKIAFIVLLVANAAAIIWQSIYLHFATVKIKLGEPIQGKLYAMSSTTRNVWQTAVIVVLVANCLTIMVAIYAAIRQRYWFLWIITVMFYLFAAFGAYTELQRGSITAWLLPMACGHTSVVLTHQTAINHYSI